jgi:oxaloacetate decarboxylase alpha subunit
MICGDEEPIDCRPADLLQPELERLKAELPEKYNEQPEDVLTLAQFPQVAPKFFEKRQAKKYGVNSAHAVDGAHPV